MDDVIEYMAVLGTLGGVIAFAAAAFIFRTAPDARVGVRFGGLLVLQLGQTQVAQAQGILAGRSPQRRDPDQEERHGEP